MGDKNHSGGNGNNISNTDALESNGDLKARNDLQKEILAALFNAPERSEDLCRRSVKTTKKRSGAFRQVVMESPRDEEEHDTLELYRMQDNVDADDEDDSYQILRKAVKEYRGTMKEYYKAAIDAFASGDHVRAGRLLEKGHFFQQKAREADKESSQMILKTGDEETQDEMLLDLHDYDAKEAISILKCHLSSLSGIPSIKYLKVIVDANDEDYSKGSRRQLGNETVDGPLAEASKCYLKS